MGLADALLQPVLLAILLFAFLCALILAAPLTRQYPKLRAALTSFADRLTLPAILFLIFDLLAGFNILLRNLGT